MLRDYYEVLGVAQDATETDIKKAYKRMALKLHPDKNRNRMEEAEKEFKELSNAYTTLVDKNERAWYDSHKDQILRGAANDDDYEPDHVNIYPFFSPNCFHGFDPSSAKSFYGVYSKVFATLAAEERPHLPSGKDHVFTTLGGPTTPIAEVNAFYDQWRNFVTHKNFSWKDKYNPNEAESRQVRRLIEKENNKERSKAKREYNESIRSLATHVRKLDKRIIEHRRQQQLKEEEERCAKDAKRRVELEARRKAVNEAASTYWEELENDFDFDEAFDVLDQVMEQGMSEKQKKKLKKTEAEEQDYYCQVCKKLFRSKPKMDEHKLTKKHKENWKKKGHLFPEPEEEKEEEEDEEEEEEKEEEEEEEGEEEGEEEASEATTSSAASEGVENSEEGIGAGSDDDGDSKKEEESANSEEGIGCSDEESESQEEAAPTPAKPPMKKSPHSRKQPHSAQPDSDDDSPAPAPMAHARGKKKSRASPSGIALPATPEDTFIDPLAMLKPSKGGKSRKADEDDEGGSSRRGKPNKKQLARERAMKEKEKEAEAKAAKKQAEEEVRAAAAARREENRRKREEELRRARELRRQQEETKKRSDDSGGEEGIGCDSDSDDDEGASAPVSAPEPVPAAPSCSGEEDEKAEETEEKLAPPPSAATPDKPKEEEEIEEPRSYQEYNAMKTKKQQTAKSIKKGETTLACGTCYEEFPSRNKLFDHIKKTNHAMYKEDKGGKKKKARK